MTKIVQLPSGARATQLLIRNLHSAGRSAPYSERDLATPDGEINEHVIIALAWHHAQRDQDAFKARGEYEPISGLYRSQLRSFTSLARSMAVTRKAHKEVGGLSLREKLIRSLELELCKAEHGLAMGPVDTENVARLKKQIEEASTATVVEWPSLHRKPEVRGTADRLDDEREWG